MTEEHRKFEKSVKRVFRFGWTPQFEESFNTKINKTVFSTMVGRTFENLHWTIGYLGENIVEARRTNDYSSQPTELITITYNNGLINVKSVSASALIDLGANSKRVKLFIHVFNETLKEFDEEELKELSKEIEEINNWEKYVVPTELIQPQKRIESNIYTPIIGGVVLALFLGYILAFVTVSFGHMLVVDGVVTGIIIGFVFKYLIQIGNYTHFEKLKNIFIGVIVITFLSNLYFQYNISLDRVIIFNINFFEFISFKFQKGVMFESLNLGWIGVLLIWVLQIIGMYLAGMFGLTRNLISYQIDRIPDEVVNYTWYLFAQDYTEEKVRKELAKKGWSEAYDQDQIFECIGAIEINRN